MKISVKASTKEGYVLPVWKALYFGGRAAGVCYMPDDYEVLESEPHEKTEKRAQDTLKNGHHSVQDHNHFCFLMEGIPKILAMILNNEKVYGTSEKSGRYTKMTPGPREELIYNKWRNLIKDKIIEIYPETEEKAAYKLAQENARYFISVFTPATTMLHTLDIKQLNYILHWSEEFIKKAEGTKFNTEVKKVLMEFIYCLSDYYVVELNDEVKKKGLSLFDTRESRQEEFGENYMTTYWGSFTQLAQAQRHRTLSYHMVVPELEKSEFYVPKIVADSPELTVEWLADMKSLADLYPQGMLISIREQGSYENFMRKCTERFCSKAQLETSIQTRLTMDKYLAKTKDSNPEVYQRLKEYDFNARCGWGYPCANHCKWGNNQLKRKI